MSTNQTNTMDGLSALDATKVAAAFGALSALVVFLASLGSVMYTRGVLAELGFPAALLSMGAGVSLFSVLSYKWSLVAVGLGIYGFVRRRPGWVSDSLLRIIAAITIVALPVSFLFENGLGDKGHLLYLLAAIRFLLDLLTAVLCVLMGFAFQSPSAPLRRYSKTLFFGLAALAAFSISLRELGAAHAFEAKRTEWPPKPSCHFVFTATDFAVVKLISKEKLPFLGETDQSGPEYTYAPRPSHFLRFIAEDDSKYLVEWKYVGEDIPVVLKKDAVSALVFCPRSAVARPLP